MSNNMNRDLITSFIGMTFLLAIFLVSISFTHQVVYGQNLDRVINDDLDRELELYESSKVVPIYQGSEEIVNDTPLESIIHGQCGTHPNTCVTGIAVNIRKDRGSRWSCQGRNGGSAAPCYIKESAAERKQRRQIELTQKIDQEISTHIESERLKTLEEHGQETLGRLENKDDDEDSFKNQQAAVQHNASLNTVQQTYPTTRNLEDEVKVYITGGAGMSMFPSVDNISNGLNATAGFGAKFPINFLFEVGFGYSDFRLDNNGYYYANSRATTNQVQCFNCRIKEYAGILSVKYHIFNQVLKPFVGTSGIYRYRDYKEDTPYGNYDTYYDNSSHGFDMGLNFGVDFALSSQFMVGVEGRYMFNLMNSVSDSHMIYRYRYSRRYPDEKLSDDLSYFTFGLNAKFLL